MQYLSKLLRNFFYTIRTYLPELNLVHAAKLLTTFSEIEVFLTSSSCIELVLIFA